MTDVVLAVQDLSVALPASGARVVDGVSFDVRAGEIMCVVGESGSGKSVTSLAIMGLLDRRALRPAGGRIMLNGEDLLASGPSRLRDLRAAVMAMIFQEPMSALNPVMRIGKQIEEVLSAHGQRLSRAQRRAKILSALDEVHLPDLERIYDCYPHQLSGGQRQRVMIAMALILEPRLLIADEPTTALDVTTQKQIIRLIAELRAKRGTAVVFITHDMGLVAEIGDRVTVMRAGKVLEVGSVEQVLKQPTHKYTRNLLKSVPSLIPRNAKSCDPAPVVLETRGLSKTYVSRSLFKGGREVKAAEGVDLCVRQGQTVGIVGESGSGKSTVARCIVRLLTPTAGSILVRGAAIESLSSAELKPFRRKIQFIFQDPNRSLNPRLPIGESIIEGPTTFGMERSQALEKARRMIEEVGLPRDCLDRFPHQFSGGQRQRIAIARALICEPDVLVADEAVSALDVSVQAQVLDLLVRLQENFGIGILFITHDLRVAAQICNEVVVMKHGKIVETGLTSAVLVNPKSDYTRDLIDAAPGRHWDFANFRPL